MNNLLRSCSTVPSSLYVCSLVLKAGEFTFCINFEESNERAVNYAKLSGVLALKKLCKDISDAWQMLLCVTTE